MREISKELFVGFIAAFIANMVYDSIPYMIEHPMGASADLIVRMIIFTVAFALYPAYRECFGIDDEEEEEKEERKVTFINVD